MEGLRRIFVAAPIESEARHRIAHLLGERITDLPGRAVAPEKWHLTLRFLGDIDDLAYDRLVACLDEADLGGPIGLRWAGLGAFPKATKATVLWVGLDHGESELHELEQTVDEAIDRAGFAPEDRPFNPHLTLSRVQPPEDLRDLIARVEPLHVSMTLDRIVIYESHLGRGGARYEPLEEFPLRG